jgi:hypothetical protein
MTKVHKDTKKIQHLKYEKENEKEYILKAYPSGERTVRQ